MQESWEELREGKLSKVNNGGGEREKRADQGRIRGGAFIPIP
jgi:hypothetical protein